MVPPYPRLTAAVQHARLISIAMTACVAVGAAGLTATAVGSSVTFILVGAACAITQLGIAVGYWTWIGARLSTHQRPRLPRRAVYVVYAVGTAAIAAFPLALALLFLNPPRGVLPTEGILIGGGLYALACGAYVHIFLVKLVRSPADNAARIRRRQVDARLMRDLTRWDRRSKRR